MAITTDVITNKFGKLCFQYDTYSGYIPSYVDTDKLMILCEKTHPSIVAGSETWSMVMLKKIESEFTKSINPGYALNLPQVHLNVERLSFCSKLRKKFDKNYEDNAYDRAFIGISSGRHCIRLLHEIRVKRIPVLADKVNHDLLMKFADGDLYK
tara:strand:- start:1655 stop:2116 length:462 start_codon:yes stop_codon:yes gene_type:complete